MTNKADQITKQDRMEWLERWLGRNPFYASVDYRMVMDYHNFCQAPYTRLDSDKLGCQQLNDDLEALVELGGIDKAFSCRNGEGDRAYDVITYDLKASRLVELINLQVRRERDEAGLSVSM
ncbi:hypothetical protein P5704_024915 (plasmid) [Pseudomonas sp. FeN3W]|nr:hypothetical protein P5704_024915 [Pseudomonas sp. FeN3W]